MALVVRSTDVFLLQKRVECEDVWLDLLNLVHLVEHPANRDEAQSQTHDKDDKRGALPHVIEWVLLLELSCLSCSFSEGPEPVLCEEIGQFLHLGRFSEFDWLIRVWLIAVKVLWEGNFLLRYIFCELDDFIEPFKECYSEGQLVGRNHIRLIDSKQGHWLVLKLTLKDIGPCIIICSLLGTKFMRFLEIFGLKLENSANILESCIEPIQLFYLVPVEFNLLSDVKIRLQMRTDECSEQGSLLTHQIVVVFPIKGVHPSIKERILKAC